MRTVRFTPRATNLTILAMLTAAAFTGIGSFLAGSPSDRWVLWLHAVAGSSLAVLLGWKRAIIFGSFRRRGLGAWAIQSLLLLLLLLLSLLSGLLWSSSGLPAIGSISGLTLHAVASAALAIVVLPHAVARWPRVRLRGLANRRSFLRTGLLLAAGFAVWRATELSSCVAGLSGSRRRFTGSREAASVDGSGFPANSWLADDPDPLATATWRLTVAGTVGRRLQLDLPDLTRTAMWTATLDCTGGWFSTQRWQGVPLSSILERAGPGPAARSVVVRSVTGYWRRFSLEHAGMMLLATCVSDQPLTHEHGAPLRLVVPGHRGYDWVKWVTTVEVSTWPAWWRWPLPVS